MNERNEDHALAEANEEHGAADAGDRVSALLQVAETKSGDAPQQELDQLGPVCTVAEQNYQSVLEHIKTIRNANGVLQKFHAGTGEVTPEDVEQAKQQFHDAKESYIQLGNQINEGIKQVHSLAKTYPEDLTVQRIYITYLAKLLCSLEARNPVELYVRRLAEAVFTFERITIELTEEEERRGTTLQYKKKEALEEVHKHVARLEARYQKRQLNTRLRAGEAPRTIARQLNRLIRQDPEDLHSYIWVANMLAKELPKSRDQNRRLEMRDDILNYCQRALSIIDDFLNLQGIENLSERDKRRAEYVKTIAAIRKPLVGNG